MVFSSIFFFPHRLMKRQPVLPVHQQVSFASIMKSQETERNQNRYVPPQLT